MQQISSARAWIVVHVVVAAFFYMTFVSSASAAGCDAAYKQCIGQPGASKSACIGQWKSCLTGQCMKSGNICNQDSECQMYCTEEGTSTGGKISCCSGGPQIEPGAPNPCPDKIDGKCEAKMPEMMMGMMMGAPMLPMLPMMMPKMDMPMMMMPDPCETGGFRSISADGTDPCATKKDKKSASTTDDTLKKIKDVAGKKDETGKSYTEEDTAKEAKGLGSVFGAFFEGVDTTSARDGGDKTQDTTSGALNTFGNAVLGQQNTTAVSQTIAQITQAVRSVAQTIITGFDTLGAPAVQQLQNALSAATLVLKSLLGSLGL